MYNTIANTDQKEVIALIKEQQPQQPSKMWPAINVQEQAETSRAITNYVIPYNTDLRLIRSMQLCETASSTDCNNSRN